jgi:hypothetical protein
VDVPIWWEQRVEIAAVKDACLLDLKLSPVCHVAPVQSAIDNFGLLAAIKPYQTPGQVIVHGRGLAGWDHQAEQAERSIARAEEQPLSDPATHAAPRVGLRECSGQPGLVC